MVTFFPKFLLKSAERFLQWRLSDAHLPSIGNCCFSSRILTELGMVFIPELVILVIQVVAKGQKRRLDLRLEGVQRAVRQ